MGKVFPLIVICLALLATGLRAEEASVNEETEDLETLNSEAYSLLGEMEALQQEIVYVKRDIEMMERQIRGAQEKLKKISIASTPARFLKKTIKKLEPELESAAEALVKKSKALQSKLISLGLLEEKISLLENSIQTPLLNVISRQLRETEEAGEIEKPIEFSEIIEE